MSDYLSVANHKLSSLIPKERCVCKAFTGEDVFALCTLEQELNVSPWNNANFLSSLKKQDICFGVYRQSADGNEWLGYLVCSRVLDEAELLIVGVAKPWQGKGLGRLLITTLISALKQQGPQQCKTLFLEVRESNESAIHLYEDLGFNCVGTRPNYYPKKNARNGREDALLFAVEIESFRGFGK